jgi:hypothetical protein
LGGGTRPTLPGGSKPACWPKTTCPNPLTPSIMHNRQACAPRPGYSDTDRCEVHASMRLCYTARVSMRVLLLALPIRRIRGTMWLAQCRSPEPGLAGRWQACPEGSGPGPGSAMAWHGIPAYPIRTNHRLCGSVVAEISVGDVSDMSHAGSIDSSPLADPQSPGLSDEMGWDGRRTRRRVLALSHGARSLVISRGHLLSPGVGGACGGWRGLGPPDLSRGVTDDEGGHNESAPQVSSHQAILG